MEEQKEKAEKYKKIVGVSVVFVIILGIIFFAKTDTKKEAPVVLENPTCIYSCDNFAASFNAETVGADNIMFEAYKAANKDALTFCGYKDINGTATFNETFGCLYSIDSATQQKFEEYLQIVNRKDIVFLNGIGNCSICERLPFEVNKCYGTKYPNLCLVEKVYSFNIWCKTNCKNNKE